jgi:hypothetical protein
MKTDKKRKEFDAVQFMRQVRDKISAEICDMSPEQIFGILQTTCSKRENNACSLIYRNNFYPSVRYLKISCKFAVSK